VKPLMYAVAASDCGLEEVHRCVGIEASGLKFNDISLNASGLPHNPMLNTGAIATGACVRPDDDMAGRFEYFLGRVLAMAGGVGVAFSEPTYLCETESAWRNNAIRYFMEDAGVLRPGNAKSALDFYIQCCSMEVSTLPTAVIAATLANGGVCPTTGETCLPPHVVNATLTHMFSSGMYDYSGK
jgi:glutaminase